MAKMTLELQVDILVCVTRHWMRDEHTTNLYCWWPGDKKPPVVILSCAGFEELASAGVETDRFFANLVVEALAGFLGNMGTHRKGAKDCPMYYDEGRDYGHTTASLKFDKI